MQRASALVKASGLSYISAPKRLPTDEGPGDEPARQDFDVLRELVQLQGEEIASLRRELAELKTPRSE
jgi:hypothetical protein